MEKKVRLPKVFDRLAVRLPLCIIAIELFILMCNKLYYSYKKNTYLNNMNVHALSHSKNYTTTYILIVLTLLITMSIMALIIKTKFSSK